MGRTLLPVAVMNVQNELDGGFPDFLKARRDIEQHLTVSTLFRQLAVGSLLLTSDPRLFYAYLFRAARAFAHGLDSSAPEDLVTSRFSPFLDALACRDDVGARRIAEAAPDAPRLDREYEEDFLYLRILMDLYLGRTAEVNEAAIRRYAELAADNPDPRLPLCTALVRRDAEAFAAALDDAIEHRQRETRLAIESDSMDPDEAALSAVSIEVLAWLELATRAGVPLRDSYPLAPAIARAFHRRQFPDPHSWQDGSGAL